MAQRSVELVIGRLVTDETFRMTFIANPTLALTTVVRSGYELTALEVAALISTDISVWAQAAEQIDPRLQKVSLTAGFRKLL